MPWDADGMSLFGSGGTTEWMNLFPILAADPTLTEAQRLEILAGFIESMSIMGNAYYQSFPDFLFEPLGKENYTPAHNYFVEPGDQHSFDSMFPKVYEMLKHHGIELFLGPSSIGVKFDHPPDGTHSSPYLAVFTKYIADNHINLSACPPAHCSGG